MNSEILLHCSDAPLFSEQWSMPPLFTEQCIMVEFLSRARKQQISAFHLPAFHTQFMVGLMHNK
jgi:hypothetical protein